VKGGRWLPVIGIALVGGLLTWLNRGERVVLHAGITTFYRAPLTVVLFVAFVAGMLTMMALSLRHDLRIREELRARGLLDDVLPPAGGASAAPRHDPVETAQRSPVDGWRAEAAAPQSPWAGMDTPRRAPDDDATIPHPREADPPAY
jgi:hypothetical protein